jgi:hypothetical protein
MEYHVRRRRKCTESIEMNPREFRDEFRGRGINWFVRKWCLKVHKSKQFFYGLIKYRYLRKFLKHISWRPA